MGVYSWIAARPRPGLGPAAVILTVCLRRAARAGRAACARENQSQLVRRITT